MPRTKYATDSQEAAADRLIESVRPAVDALNEKHPGTWGLVKTALAGLVYNDCNWVANSVAAALQGKGDPSVYVDARVGLKAVDGKWFSRKTPAQITTAVAEIGKLMRGERKGNPGRALRRSARAASQRNPRVSSLARLPAATLAERASKAGWHDTTTAGRTKLLAYVNEMRQRLGHAPLGFAEFLHDPNALSNTLREFHALEGAKKNPRIVAGWSTHRLGGGKQWFKRLSGGASVNVQQIRKGAAYEARKIDSAGKQHHLGSAATLAAAKKLALGAKSNPKRNPNEKYGATKFTHVERWMPWFLDGFRNDTREAIPQEYKSESSALRAAKAAYETSHPSKKRNPKPLSKKALDRLIESLYYKHASGLQINIMDIGKVFKMGEQAYAAGGNVEQAVKDAIKVYCIKANPKKGRKMLSRIVGTDEYGRPTNDGYLGPIGARIARDRKEWEDTRGGSVRLIPHKPARALKARLVKKARFANPTPAEHLARMQLGAEGLRGQITGAQSALAKGDTSSYLSWLESLRECVARVGQDAMDAGQRETPYYPLAHSTMVQLRKALNTRIGTKSNPKKGAKRAKKRSSK